MFRKGWANNGLLAQDDIPRDTLLPRIAAMLDGRAMAGVLRDAMPSSSSIGRSGIARCRVVNVRYRPGRQCTVSYALAMDGPGHERPETGFAVAQIVSEAFGERRLATRLSAARAAGVPLVHIPEHRMMLVEFPYDLRIHGLHRVIDPGGLERIVRRVLEAPEAELDVPDRDSPPISVVSYRPERSCLLRFAIRRTPMARHREFVFGRVYRGDRGRDAHETMAALWNCEARRSGLLSVAEPLGYDPDAHILFQRATNGVPLGDMAPDEGVLDHVAAVARDLAAIHGSRLQVGPAQCTDDELAWIESIAGGLARVLPDAGDGMMGMVGRLRDTRTAIREDDKCLIHGDFSANQILAGPGGVTVLDFDDAGMGDPHADLGTFLARLEGRFQTHDGALRQRAADIFRQEYAATRRVALDVNRLLWFQAKAFVRLALSALGQLKPGWPARLRGFLGRAEATLNARMG